MRLKDLRLAKGLTQKAAADFVGMPLRTYQRYENSAAYEHSIKYRYICQRVERYGYIDEKHGVLTMEQIGKACVKVCAEYSLQYCYLFGSYARGCATGASDVDLLVSSDEHSVSCTSLAETFRESLKKRVDLLYPDQLEGSISLVKDILQDGILLYRRGSAEAAVCDTT
ncbi:MAG: nucleotidyltransferase domain-containing protein [Clostridia bacterium]|nr:nucleotidyltransferase domain-containing protein [Clostridia bacterium]